MNNANVISVFRLQKRNAATNKQRYKVSFYLHGASSIPKGQYIERMAVSEDELGFFLQSNSYLPNCKPRKTHNSPWFRLQVDNVGELRSRDYVSGFIFIAAELIDGTGNMTQEVPFGTRIARGIVGDPLEAGEHPCAGGFPAPLTAVAVELEESPSVQDDECQRNRILIRRRDIAVDISIGIAPCQICLVEAEFRQELEEVARLELSADVGGIARGNSYQDNDADASQENSPAIAGPPFTSYQLLLFVCSLFLFSQCGIPGQLPLHSGCHVGTAHSPRRRPFVHRLQVGTPRSIFIFVLRKFPHHKSAVASDAKTAPMHLSSETDVSRDNLACFLISIC